ncbi:MAG: GNVR domain-containing protein [Gammaproteobacteria bacterium]
MTPDTEISVQDYLAIIIRRRWLLIVPTVAVVLVSIVVGFSLPKIYKTEAVLLIQDPKIMNPLIQGMAVSSPVGLRMRLVQEELLGWTSLSRLVQELGLDRRAKTPAGFESLVKRLKRDIVVSAGKGNLLTLSYTNANPALAQNVLNTITTIYIQRNVESQTSEAKTAIRFIESELNVYKAKLELSERALREFKELYTMEMPVAAKLNSQIITLQVQLAQVLVENTEAHPVVVAIKRQIAELKENRNNEIRRIIAAAITKSSNPDIYQDFAKALESDAQAGDPTVEAARTAYQLWVQRLDNPMLQPDGQPAYAPAPGEASGQASETQSPIAVDVTEGGIMSISLAPRQEQELSRLRRDYEVHRRTYQEMQQRLERAKITQRLGDSDEGTKFKVIEPARLPLRPVSPNMWLIFCGSLAAGLFLGACLAFAAEYFDQSIQSDEDVHAVLGLPVIGSIFTIITPADIEARRKWLETWMSGRAELERLNTYVWKPIWSRVDRWLLRWGL